MELSGAEGGQQMVASCCGCLASPLPLTAFPPMTHRSLKTQDPRKPSHGQRGRVLQHITCAPVVAVVVAAVDDSRGSISHPERQQQTYFSSLRQIIQLPGAAIIDNLCRSNKEPAGPASGAGLAQIRRAHTRTHTRTVPDEKGKGKRGGWSCDRAAD